MGSSIVKRAFMVARGRSDGSNLGVHAQLWWQGYSGLTLKRTQKKLGTLLQVEDPPEFILLHVGGNDLKRTPVKALKDVLISLFAFIKETMPRAKVIWSDILPRNWGDDNKGLMKARKRLNTFAIKLSKQSGGYYVRHMNLAHIDHATFLEDGVHLSPLGNELFLNNIVYGLQHFVGGRQPWFT